MSKRCGCGCRKSWETIASDAIADRDKWIRAFNRLEKAATDHVQGCIDSAGLAHAHRAVMRDLGPPDA